MERFQLVEGVKYVGKNIFAMKEFKVGGFSCFITLDMCKRAEHHPESEVLTYIYSVYDTDVDLIMEESINSYELQISELIMQGFEIAKSLTRDNFDNIWGWELINDSLVGESYQVIAEEV